MVMYYLSQALFLLTHSRDEVGVSKIFDFHAEEYIQHNPSVASLRGRAEKPDRIIGLRKTKRFDRLLSRKNDHGEVVGSTIRSCPFKRSAALLIFPFLVLEAKSEKAGSSGTGVQVQAACSIVTLIQIQQDLADSAKRPDDILEPMVWFLTNKGEHWTVAAGVIDDIQGGRSYVSLSTLLAQTELTDAACVLFVAWMHYRTRASITAASAYRQDLRLGSGSLPQCPGQATGVYGSRPNSICR